MRPLEMAIAIWGLGMMSRPQWPVIVGASTDGVMKALGDRIVPAAPRLLTVLLSVFAALGPHRPGGWGSAASVPPRMACCGARKWAILGLGRALEALFNTPRECFLDETTIPRGHCGGHHPCIMSIP